MSSAQQPKKRILVTGGTGYIGSHTTIELINAGYEVVIVDNLVNSSPKVLDRLHEIIGVKPEFHKIDLCDLPSLRQLFQAQKRPFDACIHFAGLKAVGESVDIPLRYYDNNITGTLNLLKCMEEFSCHAIVFSSSACVYGAPESVPIRETAGVHPTNPYGRTKMMIEDILSDMVRSSKSADWRVVLLRYFNPIGAHASGKIGEDPRGIPNNVAPYIAQVAVKRRPYLTIFGDDWPTPDGTGVRDYIHVVDLAQGHLSALSFMFKSSKSTESKEEKKASSTASVVRNGGFCEVINLGTGQGYSVKQLLDAFSKAAGHKLEFKVGSRRAGDVATCYSDASKALQLLGWKAKLSLEEACASHLKWQTENPNGFDTEKPQERKEEKKA